MEVAHDPLPLLGIDSHENSHAKHYLEL